jgi:aminopeptidase
LDEADPVAKWQSVNREQDRIMNILNSLPIDKIHVVAPGTDLWYKYGEKRRFVGGSGRNIPSFEIFTSPDWRGTNGTIQFTEPLYRYGNLITDIHLTFKDGIVIAAKATKGQKLLEEMLKRPNANKVGEFSMTDGRMSKITKFMANTLFDENVGGRFGNTHLAVGMSYKDAYAGSPVGIPKKEWTRMGFNDSGEHCDIVATSDRTITFIMTDGSEKVIFANGKFQI